MSPDHSILFDSIDIGPMTLPNRLYQPPYASGFGLSQLNAKHRAGKAKGGFGMVCLGATSVHPSSDASPTELNSLWAEDSIDQVSEISTAIHHHGAKAFVELTHLGKSTANRQTKLPPMSSSPIPARSQTYTTGEITPKRMDLDDIDEIVQAFGTAAQYAKAGGLDGIEIHAAHGHLISQFLSPLHNKRTDTYGGSLENRMRFFEEVIDAVVGAVGGELAVGARFTVNEMVEGGLTEDQDGLAILKQVQDSLDFLDLDIGGRQALHESIAPSSHRQENYQVEYIETVSDVIDTPIGVTGRIKDPDAAAAILRQGHVDLIGMARQSIADPNWPAKVKDGNPGEIRECVGGNDCLAALFVGGKIICTQNPTVQHEDQWRPDDFEPVESPDDIVIIGGGPAGLECARVAGKRGHQVHLYEQENELGGRVNLLAELPRFEEWVQIREWREARVRTLETVTTTTNRALTVDDALEVNADSVVVATGASYDPEGVSALSPFPIPGWDQRHVLTPNEALARDFEELSVLVYDCEGARVGAGLTEQLFSSNNEVTYVTPSGNPHSGLLATQEQSPLLSRIGDEVEYRTSHMVEGISGKRVVLTDQQSGEETELDAESTILLTRRVPNDDLYTGMKDRIRSDDGLDLSVHSIGDCSSPRPIAEAIFEGHQLGRKL